MLIQHKETMQEITRSSPLITQSPTSPSFNFYSSSSTDHNLAEIADRVVQELSISDHRQPPEHHHQQQEDDFEEEEEFEFTFVYGPETEQTSPVSADDIFYNGKIMPVYPLFDSSVLYNNKNNTETSPTTPTETTTKTTATTTKTVRLPLRKLFNQETLMSSSSSCSSSSSESERQESFEGGLEGLPTGTYCVWEPRKKGGEEKRHKIKSNSTGSSKRWKLRDLLYRRSNSDGKETFVLLDPAGKRLDGGRRVGDGSAEQRRKKTGVKTGEVKRQSYLPYRKDLVGFFHPF